MRRCSRYCSVHNWHFYQECPSLPGVGSFQSPSLLFCAVCTQEHLHLAAFGCGELEILQQLETNLKTNICAQTNRKTILWLTKPPSCIYINLTQNSVSKRLFNYIFCPEFLLDRWGNNISFPNKCWQEKPQHLCISTDSFGSWKGGRQFISFPLKQAERGLLQFWVYRCISTFLPWCWRGWKWLVIV